MPAKEGRGIGAKSRAGIEIPYNQPVVHLSEGK